NEESIRAKLKVPKELGIKGTGSWALYHETLDTWDYYLEALNWENLSEPIQNTKPEEISAPEGVSNPNNISTPDEELKAVEIPFSDIVNSFAKEDIIELNKKG